LFKHEFVEISTKLSAVVAYQCLPMQKADVVRLNTKKRICCIDDSRNNVSMIQAADVGMCPIFVDTLCAKEYSRSLIIRSLQFEESSGYLEDLVARIDAPRLYHFFIMFFYQTNFSIPPCRTLGHPFS
jgi:hypothetical protein